MDKVVRRIPKNVVRQYLSKKFGKKVRILEYSKLGSGFVAEAYKVICLVDSNRKIFVIRTLSPYGFSHEYASDRAGYFLLQNQLASLTPDHVKSYGVGGLNFDSNSVYDVSKCEDFFQIIDYIEGIDYFSDLIHIAKEQKLSGLDRLRIKALSAYLVGLHSNKRVPTSSEFKKMRPFYYLRHTRDFVGSQVLFDVLDSFPKIESLRWVTRSEINNLLSSAINFRERIKSNYFRIRQIVGDFHPGNIIFQKGSKFVILDASRAIWGEPADDVASFLVNYYRLAILNSGKFDGVFKEAFEIFLNNYLEKTKDKKLMETIGLFFAVRAIILAHPTFFDQSDQVRRKMFEFARKCLEEKVFIPERF